jgi:hypothetical protein
MEKKLKELGLDMLQDISEDSGHNKTYTFTLVDHDGKRQNTVYYDAPTKEEASKMFEKFIGNNRIFMVPYDRVEINVCVAVKKIDEIKIEPLDPIEILEGIVNLTKMAKEDPKMNSIIEGVLSKLSQMNSHNGIPGLSVQKVNISELKDVIDNIESEGEWKASIIGAEKIDPSKLN